MQKTRKDLAPAVSIPRFFAGLLIITLLNVTLFIDHAIAAAIYYVPGTTQKICQLTGEIDNQFATYTINQTESKYGVQGTDLGSSFEHNNKIYFLFGDTRTQYYTRQAVDCIAHSTDVNPDDCVDLTFNTTSYNSTIFQPPYVKPLIDQGGCSVPTEGLSHNGIMYVYFITDNMCDDGWARSVFAKSTDNGLNFNQVYDLSSSKFINVQVEVVGNSSDEQYNGVRQLLPPEVHDQPVVFIWGSGQFRASNPYLAYILLDDIEDITQLRYFTGTNESHLPTWSTSESDAIDLFEHPCIGELSISWNPYLKKWLMLYAGWGPLGVHFRVADYPWGPWSNTQLLFDPFVDKGYCDFIHAGDCTSTSDCYYVESCDQNYDDLQSGCDGNGWCRWGAAYGSYVINNFTRGVEDHETTIYFTLSTWNPYQVMLMKSTLKVEETDRDNDGIGDSEDNCPDHYNPGQEDNYPTGGDGCGDACECRGDIDRDRDVDGIDVYHFIKEWKVSVFRDNNCSPQNPCRLDFDCDGDVDASDLYLFRTAWQKECFRKRCTCWFSCY